MRTDLIFHVVSRRKWPELNKNGYYSSENSEETGGVNCVKAEYLQNHLNQEYKDRKNLLILVIDVSRLTSKVSDKSDGKTVFIEGKVNLDAILDKIRIDCSEDGSFDISVDSE